MTQLFREPIHDNNNLLMLGRPLTVARGSGMAPWICQSVNPHRRPAPGQPIV